jgi:hypothetical protein
VINISKTSLEDFEVIFIHSICTTLILYTEKEQNNMLYHSERIFVAKKAKQVQIVAAGNPDLNTDDSHEAMLILCNFRS